MGNDRRSERDEPDVLRVAALPGARASRSASSSRSATRGTCSATSGRSSSIRPTSSSRALRAPDAGPLIKLHESGDPAKKLDLLILGDGYTARERGKFERDARRLVAMLLGDLAVQGAAQRHQHLGTVAGGGAVGRLAAVAAHLPAVAGRRHLRRVRFRALRADLREQGVPRHRGERAVRGRRDPDQQRRPTAAAASTVCTAPWPPTACGRPTSSSTSSATTLPGLPTSTTRRTSRICRRPIGSSRGSRTRRRCSIPRR